MYLLGNNSRTLPLNLSIKKLTSLALIFSLFLSQLHTKDSFMLTVLDMQKNDTQNYIGFIEE